MLLVCNRPGIARLHSGFISVLTLCARPPVALEARRVICTGFFNPFACKDAQHDASQAQRTVGYEDPRDPCWDYLSLAMILVMPRPCMHAHLL